MIDADRVHEPFHLEQAKVEEDQNDISYYVQSQVILSDFTLLIDMHRV